MSQPTEKVFASGIYFKDPQATAPDWVVGGLSFKAEQAIAFIKEHANGEGWVKCNVKRSQGGKAYVELDTWKPNTQAGNNNAPSVTHSSTPATTEQATDDLPF
jgi:hypothetical protein